ncbi:uridine 5'-monophosphate synthase-like [Halichondria panicea]|uniref:uridine 5'-monophosphate synthase-like n=1 Tax=Halichondria panicea TaxID=6063 RepID=UPI00312B932A
MVLNNYCGRCLKIMKMKELVAQLFDIGAIKFGQFTLKSGIQSPVYFDLRLIVSYPPLLAQVSDVLWSAVSEKVAQFQSICGVPYTALPIATLMSSKHNLPMLIRRKEAKSYGTKRQIEGIIVKGSSCLVVEDVVTSGASVLETCADLKRVGLKVAHVVVLLDREQGGRGNVEREGVVLHSVLTMSQLMQYLLETGKVTSETVDMVKAFIRENSQVKIVEKCNPTIMSYTERSQLAANPIAKKLLSLMDSKETNLAFSADVKTSHELVKLADAVGPHICILKTHADIMSDFSRDTADQLKALAEKHNFVIMEDRKFADIGNTVQMQYTQEQYCLTSGWAPLVTCHPLPGPGVIDGLMSVAPPGSGCVLVAEMSSSGTLAVGEYTKGAISLAESRPESIVGVVCRNRLSTSPGLIHMTPGVRDKASGDSLGQQYISAETAIGERHTDIIIVGRGIYSAQDPVSTAKMYREKAFQAYNQRLKV